MSAVALTGGAVAAVRPAKRAEDCLGEFELTLANAFSGTRVALATLTAYGRWQPASPQSFDDPGEPAGFDITALELAIGDETYDALGNAELVAYAARYLAD